MRLRFINGSAMSIFDVRIPGLKMTVVAADGQDVEPVTVDEFRIATAEIYDVIVEPSDDRAYTDLRAVDRPRRLCARARWRRAPGMQAEVPALDAPQWLTMVDMMGSMAMGGDMAGMHDHGGRSMRSRRPMGTRRHASDGRRQADGADARWPSTPEPNTAPASTCASTCREPTSTTPASACATTAARCSPMPTCTRIGGPLDQRGPGREIELHLTGNMERYMWSFDGQKFSDAKPLHFRHGERLRIVLVNDTMMPHPIHLHGMWSEMESPGGEFQVRKHTIMVQPAQRITYLVSADALGQLGLPLPPALSHGSGHVQKGGGVMSRRFSSSWPFARQGRWLVALAAVLPLSTFAQRAPGHDMSAMPGMAHGKMKSMPPAPKASSKSMPATPTARMARTWTWTP